MAVELPSGVSADTTRAVFEALTQGIAIDGGLTVTGLATAGSTNTGSVSTAAYTDATGAANGTMIALLKGIYVQLAEINAKTPPIA